MSITLLGDNLREIYEAAHSKDTGGLQLVSDFSGARIYHESSGWGRLWKWFYTVVDCLFGKDLKSKKLTKAIKKTQREFSNHLAKTLPHITHYKTYLYKKSLGIELDEKAFHKSRHKITAWNRATGPFLQDYANNNCSKVSTLAKQFFSEDITPIASELRTLPVLQHLIDLEGYLHGPLPWELFRKLACGTKLKEKELKEILDWIYQQNKKSSPLKVRSFHLALKSFVEVMKKEYFHSSSMTDYGGTPDIVMLEKSLADLGLGVFYQKDPVHQLWRSRLEPGYVLNDSGETITLGEQLGKKETGEDNNLVFSVQEDPDKVVVIGKNQAILALKRKVDVDCSWCLHSAECYGIAPSGNFAVYERLHDSLESHSWVTKKWYPAHEDLDVLTPIQNMLQWMVKQQLSPKKLDLRDLRFNKKGQLKYGNVCRPDEFNYTALEKFVFQCAKGNKTIFCHLMDYSGLHSHSFRNYYLRMLKNGLDGKEKDEKNIAAFEKASDPRVETQGAILYDQAAEMKENCMKNILADYIVPDLEKLEMRIKFEILCYYNNLKLSGTLWPGMEQEIITLVIEKEKLQSRDDH